MNICTMPQLTKKSIFSRECKLYKELYNILYKPLEAGEYFLFGGHMIVGREKKRKGGGQKARAELYVTHSYYF